MPMPERHFDHWPPGRSRHLETRDTHLFDNLAASAARSPDKPCLIFYGTSICYAEVQRETEWIAAYLQRRWGVAKGDRVLLYMQNSPQWVLAYYAILRADAVVVPVNPMNKTAELQHLLADTGARFAFVAQDLLPQIEPLAAWASASTELATADASRPLQGLIVATYSDYLRAPTDLPVPDFIQATRLPRHSYPRCVAWHEVLAMQLTPDPHTALPGDLAVLPYTSGTTGRPKGCMHTHRSVMSTAVGGVRWFARTPDDVYLAVLPFFHVTGMAGSMNGPLFIGATIVVLPRWDREAAARLIERHRVTAWQVISTMVVDFLAHPQLEAHDLSSLQSIRGGGAAMPQAVAARLKERTGLDYIEGYGMTETLAATHINPPQQPQPQCLGIPVFDVDARLVDTDTGREVEIGQSGEVVVRGPQVMLGYWNNEAATREAFAEIDGQRFLRTGDLARIDDHGYFFMVDRLKRMINAAGYKVWPAEVESLMYRHPAVHEACVIGSPDAHRGETVKALVVLKLGEADRTTAAELMAWSREHMAAYKVPRQIDFVTALPKSGTGKVQWRELQEQENLRHRALP